MPWFDLLGGEWCSRAQFWHFGLPYGLPRKDTVPGFCWGVDVSLAILSPWFLTSWSFWPVVSPTIISNRDCDYAFSKYSNIIVNSIFGGFTQFTLLFPFSTYSFALVEALFFPFYLKVRLKRLWNAFLFKDSWLVRPLHRTRMRTIWMVKFNIWDQCHLMLGSYC